jgi:UDP:flavonoid glycosyltransferase YjiC (YdhE family)
MRFLFTTQPTTGHFHAMVPLARALKDHSHEVAFATGKGFCPVIHRVGFQHFACGLDFDGSNDILETLPQWQTIKEKPLPLGLQQLYGFIQGLGPRMADDLFDVVQAWQPAVIIRDPLEFGGYIAAECAGLAHASIMWALYIDPRYGCADALTDLRRRYGLPDDPDLSSFDRYLVLTSLPSSWTFPGAPIPKTTHAFCAPPFDQSHSETLPAWVQALPDRPVVYATLGTTFNQAPSVFRALITALGTEEVTTIMTVGRSVNPAQFQPLPDNIRLEQYIPQTLLLPHCHALIFHGGYNSLLSAIWHGLPMVLIPMGAGDQLPTAMQCADLGLGILVQGNPPEPDALRAAVRAVLRQPAYRERVCQVRRELQALPNLSEAVKLLEILAETHKPQSR